MTDPDSGDPTPPQEILPGESPAGTPSCGSAAVDDLCRICIDSAPYGVLIHDPGGRILLYNRQLEVISGYSRDEIPDISTWIDTVYPDPDYRSLVIQARQDSWSDTGVRTQEAMITRKDGCMRLCRFTSSQASAGLRIVFVRDVHRTLEIDEERASDAQARVKAAPALLSWL
jgi:PAS domain S-box-containing protein